MELVHTSWSSNLRWSLCWPVLRSADTLSATWVVGGPYRGFRDLQLVSAAPQPYGPGQARLRCCCLLYCHVRRKFHLVEDLDVTRHLLRADRYRSFFKS